MQSIITNNENPAILNNFLDYMVTVKGLSFNTYKAYNSDILMFFKFIKNYMNITIPIKDFNIFVLLKVKESDIIAFLVYLNSNRNNNPYTRERRLCAIRNFYKWLLSTTPGGHLKINPTVSIPSIEKTIRLPKYISLNHAKKIQKVFTIKNCKFPIRNNCIIILFLHTGIRIGELVGININDIDFNQKTLKVCGKGSKERIVYLNTKCIKAIKNYLNYRNRKEKIIDIKSPLFVNRYNKRLGIDGVEDICSKAFKLIGLDGLGYTAHTLRHTAATLMYIYSTSDILIIKDFLGHASITSTQIYTHVYNKTIKESIESNPLSKVA